MLNQEGATKASIVLDSPVVKEMIFSMLGFVIILFTSIKLDLFELLEDYLGESEKYELDELILTFAFFSLFLAFFSLRRWLEHKKLTKINEITNHAIVNKTKELEKQNLRNERLSELVNFLQVCNTKDEIFQLISKAADKLFVGSSGNLFITRDSRNQLSLATCWGEDKNPPDYFPPDDCWGLRIGKKYTYSSEQDNPRCRHLDGKKDSGVSTCVPLTAYGEVIGLLSISMIDKKQYEFEDEEHLLFEQSLTIFSEQISLAISNINLREKMKDLAIHDPLTGLYNRQYLRETFEREANRVKRNNSHLGMMMIDLDHFKKFNDTFGHSAGDLLLQEFGLLLKTFFRKEDFCCRFGGEEFIVLISDISKSELTTKSEELLHRTSEISLTYQNQVIGKITGSIGVAILPECGDSYSLLVEMADNALYTAKNEGRNRVCFAPTIQNNTDNLV